MLFTKLGRKIIKDVYEAKESSEVQVIADDEDDDSFRRFKPDMRFDDSEDVYYHGGHGHHDHDDGLTDD